MENKQRILDLLLPALQATRNLDDLVALQYDAESEMVSAIFPKGKKIVNVTMDSGTSMIKDILNQII